LSAWLLLSIRRIVLSAKDYWTEDGPTVSEPAFVTIVQKNTVEPTVAVGELLDPGYHVNSILFLLPLVGLLVGYKSISTDRLAGHLQTQLVLPASRSTVLSARYLARAIVVALVVIGTLFAGWILTLRQFGEAPSIGPYVVFSLATVAYALVWLSIGFLISALVRSPLTAGALVVVVFCYQIVPIHQFLLEGTGLSHLRILDPRQAYIIVATAPYDQLISPLITVEGGSIDESGQWQLRFAETPVYVSWPVGLVVLLCWILGPLEYARRRFENLQLTEEQ